MHPDVEVLGAAAVPELTGICPVLLHEPRGKLCHGVWEMLATDGCLVLSHNRSTCASASTFYASVLRDRLHVLVVTSSAGLGDRVYVVGLQASQPPLIEA